MITRSPFHLVELRPWPLFRSIRALFITCGITSWFHNLPAYTLLIGFTLTFLCIINWWRDVIREATFQGFHTMSVILGLRWGIILFIASEVLFFFAFFWRFFHRSLRPSVDLGCAWPPIGIYAINPFSIPLLNTAVLLGSGVTVTWAHHSLIHNDKENTTNGLITTVLLGAYFTYLQFSEYVTAPFSIAERVYGRVFFVATGFHGTHVLIGSTFLIICLSRNLVNQYSSNHHFGFEARAWYWHFVDVVWIFLYLCLYWWGS